MRVKQTDITIIGAGAAGLSLAVLLGHAGLNVVIVDPNTPAPSKGLKPDGRTVALMNSSINVLKACNIWEELASSSCPMEMMRIIDDSDPARERIEIDFPADEIGLTQFSYNIPNTVLRSLLFEKAQSLPSVEFIEGLFENYERDETGISVSLKNGQTFRAQLLVGADGRSSAVREFAGIQSTVKKYQQHAITCLINHSKAHQNISTEFHRPAGPMALVPMPGNQSSVVWVEKPEKAEELMHLKKQEFEQALQDKTLDILGGITLESGPASWPLCTIKAKSLSAPRVALMAEAAHVMSPITAQGLNLSLRDVAALAESIMDTARLGLDLGSKTVLNTYSKRRSADIETRVFGVDAMNSIVSTDHLGFKRLRRAGLKTVSALSPVKTLAMHIGLAPQLDMGRLLKGETL